MLDENAPLPAAERDGCLEAAHGGEGVDGLLEGGDGARELGDLGLDGVGDAHERVDGLLLVELLEDEGREGRRRRVDELEGDGLGDEVREGLLDDGEVALAEVADDLDLGLLLELEARGERARARRRGGRPPARRVDEAARLDVGDESSSSQHQPW